jgi:hypothetical protein
MGEKILTNVKGVEMGSNLVRWVGAGAVFLVILLSGYGLSRSGKPYGTLVFTVHKLLAVAAVVTLGITVYRMNRAGTLAAGGLISAIVSGVFFLGTMATGGVLSVEAGTQVTMPASVSALVHKLHQVTPYLTVLSSAAALYLLRG